MTNLVASAESVTSFFLYGQLSPPNDLTHIIDERSEDERTLKIDIESYMGGAAKYAVMGRAPIVAAIMSGSFTPEGQG